MKTFINKNANTKHGYEVVIINNDSTKQTLALDSKTTDGYLRLPKCVAEQFGRKMIAIKLLENANTDSFELTNETLKARTTSTTSTTKSTTKSLEDYLSKDDKKLYLELVAKAQKAMAIEKKQAEIKALQAEIESLKGGNN